VLVAERKEDVAEQQWRVAQQCMQVTADLLQITRGELSAINTRAEDRSTLGNIQSTLSDGRSGSASADDSRKHNAKSGDTDERLDPGDEAAVGVSRLLVCLRTSLILW
jgi:hypothetical protein